MRPTAARLIKIHLLTQAEVDVKSLRLPPSNHLNSKQKKVDEVNTVAAKLGEQMSSTTGTSTWPANLRVEKAEKKTMFWKVSLMVHYLFKRVGVLWWLTDDYTLSGPKRSSHSIKTITSRIMR